MNLVRNLAIDAVALITYIAVSLPALTSVSVHEWLGLGVGVVFLVHVALHIDWIVRSVRRRTGGTARLFGLLAFDALVFVAFVVVMVSGLMVSGTVLPTFGVYGVDGYFFWNPLHALSAKVLMALLVVHVALHWRKVLSGVKAAKASGGQAAPRPAEDGNR